MNKTVWKQNVNGITLTLRRRYCLLSTWVYRRISGDEFNEWCEKQKYPLYTRLLHGDGEFAYTHVKHQKVWFDWIVEVQADRGDGGWNAYTHHQHRMPI